MSSSGPTPGGAFFQVEGVLEHASDPRVGDSQDIGGLVPSSGHKCAVMSEGLRGPKRR